MSCDEPKDALVFCREHPHARWQGLTRVQLASHVPADARLPVRLCSPLRRANAREFADIAEIGLSTYDRRHSLRHLGSQAFRHGQWETSDEHRSEERRVGKE